MEYLGTCAIPMESFYCSTGPLNERRQTPTLPLLIYLCEHLYRHRVDEFLVQTTSAESSLRHIDVSTHRKSLGVSPTYIINVAIRGLCKFWCVEHLGCTVEKANVFM